MTDYESLLEVVVSRPTDDGPRLVLAEWLSEQSADGHNRSELIQAQVWIARNFPGVAANPWWTSEELDRMQNRVDRTFIPPDDQIAKLLKTRKREHELLDMIEEDQDTEVKEQNLTRWIPKSVRKCIGFGTPMVIYYNEGDEQSRLAAERAAQQAGMRYGIALPRPHRGSPSYGPACAWHRGFVEEISCTWKSWLDNWKDVVREAPIRKVRFTDRVPVPIRMAWVCDDTAMKRFRIDGLTEEIEANDHNVSWTSIQRKIVRQNFPGIEFDFHFEANQFNYGQATGITRNELYLPIGEYRIEAGEDLYANELIVLDQGRAVRCPEGQQSIGRAMENGRRDQMIQVRIDNYSAAHADQFLLPRTRLQQLMEEHFRGETVSSSEMREAAGLSEPEPDDQITPPV